MLAVLCSSCISPMTIQEEERETLVRIVLPEPVCRSADPDENLISDANIFIFRKSGKLERHYYLSRRDIQDCGGKAEVPTRLLTSEAFDFFACCNVGDLGYIRSEEELLHYRHHMAYPDEYSRGIPMSASKYDYAIGDSRTVEFEMVRTLSLLGLSIDRSALSPGIVFTVRKVSVGGASSSVLLFGGEDGSAGVFSSGFSKSGDALAPLNRSSPDGKSGEVSLFILANSPPPGSSGPWIEMEIDYFGAGYYSGRDQFLTYRFYTSEITGGPGIAPGCQYSFTVKPEGDGLGTPGWRTDISRLGRDFD